MDESMNDSMSGSIQVPKKMIRRRQLSDSEESDQDSEANNSNNNILSDSDESVVSTKDKIITTDVEIPETDGERSSDSNFSDEDCSSGASVILSPALKTSSAGSARRLSRKSLGRKSTAADTSSESVYLSMHGSSSSPERNGHTVNQLKSSVHSQEDSRDNVFLGEDSVNSTDSINNQGSESDVESVEEEEIKSADYSSDDEVKDVQTNGEEEIKSADYSSDDEVKDVQTDGEEGDENKIESAHSSVDDGENGVKGDLSENGVNVQEYSFDMTRDDDKKSAFSNNSVSETVDVHDVSPISKHSPKLVDLTQSDSSLQNSPVGATRQNFSKQRDFEEIVSDLSKISNDLMVKQTLLDSININTLPDSGRNLKLKVIELQKREAELQAELQQSKEYLSQKIGLKKVDARQMNATKQTLLSSLFQPDHIKTESGNGIHRLNIDGEFDDSSDEDNEDDSDYSPGLRAGANSVPEWGELPVPGMNIAGFGKRAMQTHMAEKALTIEALSTLHKALSSCPSEETYAEDPRNLRVELMPHQKHGLAWMMWREQERPPGGILADDMGLGKTLSMISLILKSKEMQEESGKDEDSDDNDSPAWMSSKYSRMPRGGTLVVCPASLISQWEGEILKRVKKRNLSVELYHGPRRETRPKRLANYDVIITTYNLVSRESGAENAKKAASVREKGPLFLIKWDRIILDEAHIVRNHKSLMALGVCELIGKRRWCLTGTPIQNKELDLYALLKFLRCEPFDDLTVWKRWVDNKNAAGMQRLNTMMKSLMLRRTKEQLQERGDLNCLPEKTFERIDVHLDPKELEIYEKVAIFSSTLFAQFLTQRAEKQQALDARYGISSKPVWEQGPAVDNQFVTTDELAKMHRKMKGITDIKTHQILVLLLRLRQICCHPGLVKKMVEDGDLDIPSGGVEDSSGLDVDLFNQMNNMNINESDLSEEENELNKSDILSVDNPVLSFDRPSAKIQAILDVLQEKIIDTEDKAIIVSQWTSMLNVIATFLKQMKIKFDTLSGQVPVDKRQDIVNEFNKENHGPQVLLLSLTAGGVGLNLVGANHLLLVDIHWNPQLEAQACDRIYRVGQKKDVFIYRFITVNTIEERIKALQDHKLTLAENVLTGTRNTQASKLTLDDLKLLFTVPSHQPTDDQL